MEKVNVTNMIANVGITSYDPQFKHNWTRVGSKFPIPKDTLDLLLYQEGVIALFKEGYLVAEEKATETLDNADSAKPVGKTYNEAQLKVLLAKPAAELGKILAEMSKASKEGLIALGKVTELTTEQIIAIKKVTGVDLTSAQAILRQEKTNPSSEDDKK